MLTARRQARVGRPIDGYAYENDREADGSGYGAGYYDGTGQVLFRVTPSAFAGDGYTPRVENDTEDVA